MNIHFNTAGFNAIKIAPMQQHPRFSAERPVGTGQPKGTGPGSGSNRPAGSSGPKGTSGK